jgi:hypothetical protein
VEERDRDVFREVKSRMLTVGNRISLFGWSRIAEKSPVTSKSYLIPT